MTPEPPRSTLFPYTTVFRSRLSSAGPADPWRLSRSSRLARIDRKSTRLNSSHLGISYAVFCLKNTAAIQKTEDGGVKIFAYPGYMIGSEISKLFFHDTAPTEIYTLSQHAAPAD